MDWVGQRASSCCLALQLLDGGGVVQRVRQAGACRNFLGIELKAVRLPGGSDLRPIFALYRGTANAQIKKEFRRRAPPIGPGERKSRQQAAPRQKQLLTLCVHPEISAPTPQKNPQ